MPRAISLTLLLITLSASTPVRAFDAGLLESVLGVLGKSYFDSTPLRPYEMLMAGLQRTATRAGSYDAQSRQSTIRPPCSILCGSRRRT